MLPLVIQSDTVLPVADPKCSQHLSSSGSREECCVQTGAKTSGHARGWRDTANRSAWPVTVLHCREVWGAVTCTGKALARLEGPPQALVAARGPPAAAQLLCAALGLRLHRLIA